MESQSEVMQPIGPTCVTVNTNPGNYGQSMEDPMRSGNKAKEMKSRASQRRATHKARRAALTLRAEGRISATKAERGKTKVASKGHVTSTAKPNKPKKR
jgi:hypothetical protein